jgi:hypothetical protein
MQLQTTQLSGMENWDKRCPANKQTPNFPIVKPAGRNINSTCLDSKHATYAVGFQTGGLI